MCELTECFYFKLKNACNGIIDKSDKLQDIEKNAIEMLDNCKNINEHEKNTLKANSILNSDKRLSILFELYDKYFDDTDNLKSPILNIDN